MDYKKKYLKYKLKYLNTKKMLTGGDRHEKNNNNDFKDSQVRSKKLGGCWNPFGCDKKPPPGPNITYQQKVNSGDEDCKTCNRAEKCYFDVHNLWKEGQKEVSILPCGMI